MHPNKRPRITPVATGVLFPKEIWQIILQLKHQDAVETMLPRWKEKHEILFSEVLDELHEVTEDIRNDLHFPTPNGKIKTIKEYHYERLYKIYWFIEAKNVDFFTWLSKFKRRGSQGHLVVDLNKLKKTSNNKRKHHGWVLNHSKKRGHRKQNTWNL
jgi:hypothetical protein